MDGMNNREYTEAYLYWSAEGVDRTVEAFDRHLQAVEDWRTIKAVSTILRNLVRDVEKANVPRTDEGVLCMYAEAVSEAATRIRVGAK